MSSTEAQSGDFARKRPAECDWFGNSIDLFDDAINYFDELKDDTGKFAVNKAAGIYNMYPQLCEMIECLGDATAIEKLKLRNYLGVAHHKATVLLMMEADRIGLDPNSLLESSRVCCELFRPVLANVQILSAYPVEWFYHPKSTFRSWPDCLGEWRYSLPTPMQEAIRQGEAVYAQLQARLHIFPIVNLPDGIEQIEEETHSPPGWNELGDAKKAILTVLKKSGERLQGDGVAKKAGYKPGSLRHHYGELQEFKYIDRTKDGYGITPAGADLVP